MGGGLGGGLSGDLGADLSGSPSGDLGGDLGAEASEVTAFWRGLGLPGLVDVHVHFMPPNVQEKVWEHLAGSRHDGRERLEIRYRLPEEERLRLLREFGIRRFGALLYPHKPGMAAWLNEWAAGFAGRAAEALHSATFYPEPGAAGYVAEALGAGAVLFKAHVQVGRYDPADELLDPVWGLLAESGVPVVVHCGSGPEPGEFTGPGPISKVLARHPRLAAIIAHMGAPEYADFVELAERHANVRLDTTLAFTPFMGRKAPYPAELLPRLAGLADRVLLGTDFPSISGRYAGQLHALAGLGLGDEWLRAVCYRNGARLFGLEGGG